MSDIKSKNNRIFHKSLRSILTELINDESAGSTIEAVMLIAFSIILFILLITMAQSIIEWVNLKLGDLFNQGALELLKNSLF